MEIIFAPKALKDRKHWEASGNKKIQNKITDLLTAIVDEPFTGIGKPELLKYEFAGCWSRRINNEHRIIYEVRGNTIDILSLKDHYE